MILDRSWTQLKSCVYWKHGIYSSTIQLKHTHIQAYSTKANSVLIESIKQLRQLTQAPFSQCKEAIIQTNGSVDNALSWLREHHCNNNSTIMSHNNRTKYGLIGYTELPHALKSYQYTYSTTEFKQDHSHTCSLIEGIPIDKTHKLLTPLQQLPSENKHTDQLLLPKGIMLSDALNIASQLLKESILYEGIYYVPYITNHLKNMRSVPAYYVHNRTSLHDTIGDMIGITQCLVFNDTTSTTLLPLIQCIGKSLAMQVISLLSVNSNAFNNQICNRNHTVSSNLSNNNIYCTMNENNQTQHTQYNLQAAVLSEPWITLPYVFSQLNGFYEFVTTECPDFDLNISVKNGLTLCERWLTHRQEAHESTKTLTDETPDILSNSLPIHINIASITVSKVGIGIIELL